MTNTRLVISLTAPKYKRVRPTLDTNNKGRKEKEMSKKNKKSRKLEKERLKIVEKCIQPSILTMLKVVSVEDLAKLVREINSDE